MNTVAILQARMSSSRLPGKVMADVVGKPMLALQIERLRKSAMISRLVVATSDQPDDDCLVALCSELNVECWRGSLDDVLDRFYRVAVKASASSIVRLTGDCPLCDPKVIDSAIYLHQYGQYDFTSNTIERTWPQGLDVEVIEFPKLEEIWRDASLPSEREHVTLRVYNHLDRYKVGKLRNPKGDFSHLRWTVDEDEDLSLIREIYSSLYAVSPNFGTEEILNLMVTRPELRNLNKDIDREAGLKKSIARDREFLAREKT